MIGASSPSLIYAKLNRQSSPDEDERANCFNRLELPVSESRPSRLARSLIIFLRFSNRSIRRQIGRTEEMVKKEPARNEDENGIKDATNRKMLGPHSR